MSMLSGILSRRSDVLFAAAHKLTEAATSSSGPSLVARGPVRCEIVETEDGFRALQAEWQELWETGTFACSCSSWEWCFHWWKNIGGAPRPGIAERRLAVFTARDSAGRLLGVLPAYYSVGLGRIGPGSAYPLGLRYLFPMGICPHEDIYSMTEEPTLLLDAEQWEPAMAAMTQGVGEFVLAKRLDIVTFDIETPEIDAIVQRYAELAKSQFRSQVNSYDSCDKVEFPADWEELRKRVSKSMRDNLAYYPKLLKRDGYDWSWRLVREPAEIPTALQAVIDLHTHRSEADMGYAHKNYFGRPGQQQFFRDLMADLAPRGKAFIGLIEIDGKPIAAQIYLEHRQECTVSYSGFQTEFYKHSPLFVLLAEVFKEGIGRGVTKANFLMTTTPWKTRWGATPASVRYRRLMLRNSPVSWARFGAFAIARAVRQKKGRLRIKYRDWSYEARRGNRNMPKWALRLLGLTPIEKPTEDAS